MSRVSGEGPRAGLPAAPHQLPAHSGERGAERWGGQPGSRAEGTRLPGRARPSVAPCCQTHSGLPPDPQLPVDILALGLKCLQISKGRRAKPFLLFSEGRVAGDRACAGRPAGIAQALSCGLALGSSRTNFWGPSLLGPGGQGSDHWAPGSSFSSHTSPTSSEPRSLTWELRRATDPGAVPHTHAELWATASRPSGWDRRLP